MKTVWRVIPYFISLICLVTMIAWMAFSRAHADEKDEYPIVTSPHADALMLVFKTQADRIRSLDTPKEWWHDVKTREWLVKRPFYPGTIDSTHLFIVTYRIDGKPLCTWFVDTRGGTVQESKQVKPQ